MLSSSSNGTDIYFYPDADGSIGSIGYNGNRYYYVRNAQNDIIDITDKTGAFVARYTYDEWGNITSITDGAGNDVSTNAAHIANLNPLRYRSYFYDAETGWYCLNTRYYDPEIGRFINADTTATLTATPKVLTDKNLFAYCDNNPIVRYDQGGQFWDILFDVVSVVTSVVEVINNPSDPVAWAGLAADVVSLAVPGVTGGGAVVKAVAKADDVVDTVKAISKVDDVADAVKVADKASDAGSVLQNGWKVGDDINTLTKAGNTPSWSTVRQRYWKNEAFLNPGSYSDSNILRMQKGRAPLVLHENGNLYSMELHHITPRSSGGLNTIDNLMPVSPWQHAMIDPYRHFKP